MAGAMIERDETWERAVTQNSTPWGTFYAFSQRGRTRPRWRLWLNAAARDHFAGRRIRRVVLERSPDHRMIALRPAQCDEPGSVAVGTSPFVSAPADWAAPGTKVMLWAEDDGLVGRLPAEEPEGHATPMPEGVG